MLRAGPWLDLALPMSRIATFCGKAGADPLVSDNPTLATNRRITIVFLRKAALTPSASAAN